MSQDFKDMIPEDLAKLFADIRQGMEGIENKAPEQPKDKEIEWNFNR